MKLSMLAIWQAPSWILDLLCKKFILQNWFFFFFFLNKKIKAENQILSHPK